MQARAADVALAFEHDPQVLAAFALLDDFLAGRKGALLHDVGDLMAFAFVEGAKRRNLLERLKIDARFAHVMPPKIVARPTRPIPRM